MSWLPLNRRDILNSRQKHLRNAAQYLSEPRWSSRWVWTSQAKRKSWKSKMLLLVLLPFKTFCLPPMVWDWARSGVPANGHATPWSRISSASSPTSILSDSYTLDILSLWRNSHPDPRLRIEPCGWGNLEINKRAMSLRGL